MPKHRRHDGRNSCSPAIVDDVRPHGERILDMTAFNLMMVLLLEVQSMFIAYAIYNALFPEKKSRN